MSWKEIIKDERESTKWILGIYDDIRALENRLNDIDIEEEFVDRDDKFTGPTTEGKLGGDSTGKGLTWLKKLSQVLFDFDEALSEVLKGRD